MPVLEKRKNGSNKKGSLLRPFEIWRGLLTRVQGLIDLSDYSQRGVNLGDMAYITPTTTMSQLRDSLGIRR